MPNTDDLWPCCRRHASFTAGSTSLATSRALLAARDAAGARRELTLATRAFSATGIELPEQQRGEIQDLDSQISELEAAAGKAKAEEEAAVAAAAVEAAATKAASFKAEQEAAANKAKAEAAATAQAAEEKAAAEKAERDAQAAAAAAAAAELEAAAQHARDEEARVAAAAALKEKVGGRKRQGAPALRSRLNPRLRPKLNATLS